MTLSDIPKTYLNAVIAVEDHRFRKHSGIDYISIARAVKSNILSGKLKEGGSTITQQLAKNLYFTQEKKFARKVAEALMAQKLEQKYSKDEILELYVNTIYFGNGCYGIAEASKGYYGKKPSKLSTEECTMLAGLPNAPSAYNPVKHPQRAKQRQNFVEKQMRRYGYLK